MDITSTLGETDLRGTGAFRLATWQSLRSQTRISVWPEAVKRSTFNDKLHSHRDISCNLFVHYTMQFMR